jgi:hypothetical protein
MGLWRLKNPKICSWKVGRRADDIVLIWLQICRQKSNVPV